MHALTEHIRKRNKEPIPYQDAVQMFLWLYCTRSILPSELCSLALGKDALVSIFRDLTRDGVISLASDKSASIDPWERLADELMSSRVCLDQTFPSKASRYL